MKNSDYLKQVSNEETAVILDELRKALTFDAEGDVVEFGCYRGDTSLLIERELEKTAAGRRLWIYDSFEGLPARTAEDASAAGDGFSKGELFVSKREVVERFKKAGLRVPRVRKGFFEDLDPGEIGTGGRVGANKEAGTSDEIGASGEVLRSSPDLPDKIIFAFLDGDLYQSIKTSLELVMPRLARRELGNPNSRSDGVKARGNTMEDRSNKQEICGVAIVHDYNNPQLPGVAKAVDEWAKKQAIKPRLQQRESLAIITW